MKRIRSKNQSLHLRTAACTVSAAALMLGVSDAATVGFNFQANYCAAASYSGAVVTGPAFGIDTNGWESLTQMETGYSCPDQPFQTLTLTIDTTSSGGGLNPLPNGSLKVTWSGYTANVSGFGGYDRSPPNYTFGGNGYKPGNEQVYWGFIRDGVNFGPGSSGGDNDQPGYSIDITGLKSVFTNTPFAVQLIASSDSMQVLTNAFIIDVTANSTQSVVYPSTPPVSDAGGAAWVRGIGGGLSTATTNALSTDHIQIIGNRAQHGGDKATGFDNASTIAGFIITDKPVISMPPNPVVVSTGDSVTWSGYAVGVPPLSYQWRHNGLDIAGATSNSYSIAKVGSGQQGVYEMVVSNAYGSAASSVFVDQITAQVVTNLVLDSNPNGPEHDGLNFGATWLANDGTHSGVMSFNATNQNQIVVPGQTNFDVGAGTITFWIRSAGPTNATGNPATLIDRRKSNGLVVVQDAGGALEVQTSAKANDVSSSSTVLTNNNWHQVAVVFNITNNESIILYIDGALDSSSANTADWSWDPGQQFELGLSHDSHWQAYSGLLDDVRFYNRALTDTEVASTFNTGALVDTNALVMRLNFYTAPIRGLNLNWQATDVILQSSDSAPGPYTDTPSVASPYPTTIKGASKFYRYNGHTPTNIVSNPYLM